jgi:hypothetical protein
MLLGSPPDMVHGASPHRTHTPHDQNEALPCFAIIKEDSAIIIIYYIQKCKLFNIKNLTNLFRVNSQSKFHSGRGGGFYFGN